MHDTQDTTSQQSGEYQVLARRTRPQSFSELVGQEVISTAMTNMIKQGKIHHAYLFTGTRGTGKTSSARILAKSLCCLEGPTTTPCQTCVHCRQITECAHDDVLEIDGASNTGVDKVRELRESARFFPNSARYKIFIIDEVHMLSTGAFNALLKTLEEPPARVIFILATTELHKVPQTVQSRCILFTFRKISHDVIAQHLKGILTHEGIPFEDDAIALIAREAKGSMRDSLSLLEQVRALCGGTRIELEQTKKALSILGQELADNLLLAIATQNTTRALDLLREADSASVDLATLLEDTASRFRHALVLRQCKSQEDARRITQLLTSEIETLTSSCQSLSVAAASEVFRTLMAGAREVGRSTSPLTWAEMAVLDAVSRADWLSASELLGSLASVPTTSRTTPQQPSATSSVCERRNTEIPQTVAPVAPSQPPLMTRTVQPGVPTPPSTQTAPAEADPSLALFERVISCIAQRNIRLANKLRQAKVERFDSTTLVFSSFDGNKTFTSLNPSDAAAFGDALVACNLEGIEIRGMHTPLEHLKLRNRKGSESTDKTPEPQPPSQPIPPRGEPGRAEGPGSLAERDKTQKIQNDLERTQRVLNAPHLQPILNLGSRSEVHPLEDDETTRL